MLQIRRFSNADLPALFDIWLGHWQAARQAPTVSVTAFERAILSRTFFDPAALLVAEQEGRVVAWCHHLPLPDQAKAPATENEVGAEREGQGLGTSGTSGDSVAVWGPPETPSRLATARPAGNDRQVSSVAISQPREALLTAICFTGESGLAACDELLAKTEQQLRDAGVRRVHVGPVRDQRHGYAGLSPVGHGIGVPVADTRTASLLSRHGYHVSASVDRLAVPTSTYRSPVNRDFLQLQRRTRVDRTAVLPVDARTAVAMSHFDVERYSLFDHTLETELAALDLWLSDVEGQVMEGGRGLLSFELLSPAEALDETKPLGSTKQNAVSANQQLTLEARYLVSAVIPTLATRNIYTIETSVDEADSTFIEQLLALKFSSVEQGRQWAKEL